MQIDNLHWDWGNWWRGYKVAQPRYGSTAGFWGITDIPYCSYCHCYWHIVIVIYYLVVGPGSSPGDWAVVLGMYGTCLKHGQFLFQLISIT